MRIDEQHAMTTRPVSTLLDTVRFFMERHVAKDDRLLLAVSGGADSTGMLGLLLELYAGEENRLAVCHVQHGLRETDGADTLLVDEFCLRRGLSCEVRQVDVPRFAEENRLSVEAAAREMRYKELRAVAAKHNCNWILTGHTLDDSAETVRMRVESGAPWYEWTGIPTMRGSILRPLSDVYRSDIRSYAVDCSIAFIEDASNRDLRFARNELRSRLAHDPSWTTSEIQKTAALGERLRVFLDQQRSLASELTNCESKQPFTVARGVAIKQILSYFTNLGFLPIEVVWAELTGDSERRLPSAVRRQLAEMVRGVSPRAELILPDSWRVIREGEMIWVCAPKKMFQAQPVVIESENDLPFRDVGTWTLADAGVRGEFVLRRWQAGDRMQVTGRPRKKIADLLSEQKLDPVRREESLVLADGDSIAGLFVGDRR